MSDPDLDAAAARELLETHAPALLGPVRAEADALDDVLARPLGLESDEQTYREALAAELGPEPEDDAALVRGLRRVRHRAVIRIALREILRLADIERTSAEMAHLAAAIIDASLGACLRTAERRDGVALDRLGERIPITVLGMGKLGGLELNLGSDVDLIFFYGTDDGDAGERTVHEHYARVARRTAKALGDVTEHGFAFRVDLRLRPEGSRGPMVNSLASAERYYLTWGRTWERAAMLRARPVAGDRVFGWALLDALRPFVYRRAVDPKIALAMHQMLLQSRRDLKVDEVRDLKLGRGGIREAEFFVQTLQLIWGGRHPELRVSSTLDALDQLRKTGLVTEREAEELARGWALLRRAEHRIHASTGVQTHTLPSNPDALEALARSLGYDDGPALEADLGARQAEIGALFGGLLEGHEKLDPEVESLLDAVARQDELPTLAERVQTALVVDDAFNAASYLTRLGRHAARPFGRVTRERSPEIGRTLLREIAGAADPETALLHFGDFFERLGGRWSYEKRLMERPRLLRRLVGLFGASPTLSRTLVGHPEDIDLLLSAELPTVDDIVIAHDVMRDHLSDDPDPEDVVRQLRQLKRVFELPIGLGYLGNDLDLGAATEQLSALATSQVRVALEAATRWSRLRHGATSGELVVVALGKLGSGDLGFAGDLDLMFLYEADGETAPTASGKTRTQREAFTRIAQRTMKLLSERDAEGPGYDTDARLRPSGSQGTLVVSIDGFDAYHAKRAAAWERQALVRARPLTGSERAQTAVAARFAELAFERGATPPDELAEARGRMQRELAGESRDRYHPKLGFGGLLDVELLAQWLQMRHGEVRSVRTPSTPRALQALAEVGALERDEADGLAEAYVFLRRVAQSLRLYDAHRELLLEPRGRTGSHVARGLGLRARDGLGPEEALDAEYRRHTTLARERFEAHVAPIGGAPPWRRT